MPNDSVVIGKRVLLADTLVQIADVTSNHIEELNIAFFINLCLLRVVDGRC